MSTSPITLSAALPGSHTIESGLGFSRSTTQPADCSWATFLRR